MKEGIISSYITFTYHFYLAILKLRLKGAFFNGDLVSSLARALLFLSSQVVVSLFCKEISLYVLACERQKGRNEMLMSIFSFYFLSFRPFLFYLVLHIFFSNVRVIMASGVTAKVWQLGQWLVWSSCLPISSTLTQFWVCFD